MTDNLNILWHPENIDDTNMAGFMRYLNTAYNLQLNDYPSLYKFSIDHKEEFWSCLWDFAEITGTKGEKILENAETMLDSIWFADSKLNYSENLLSKNNADPAIIFWGEDKQKASLNYKELNLKVASIAAYLKAKGVGPADVVAGFMPNVPETVVAMLATASLGATWTSCSPDFGEQGVLDRFGQVKPKVLITANAYFYNGKIHDCLEKTSNILKSLPCVKSTLIVPYAKKDINTEFKADFYPEVLDKYKNYELEFTRVEFNSPLFIMYSSGTTGKPKCIVHGVGGTLLQHIKEHQLHVNLSSKSRIFYFTTCGWMMWNWLVSALASGSTFMLYDGSPFYPDESILLDFAEQEKINVFGVSAKYLDVLRKSDKNYKLSHDLGSLDTVLSTGSVLSPECFDYVYNKIKSDVCLSSISGGTDIISCFALGCPILPVRRGELQCKGLGMQVEIFDDNKRPVVEKKGELVCSGPFPSMPIYFWDDPGKEKYKNAYFAKYQGIWCHGDYVKETANGGLVFYGRSDAILNPGGVRIGTAEIYRQVEKLDQILESIVIGQNWQDDVRVVLFVRLAPNIKLDANLTDKIKRQIRTNTTPRHVPAKVIAVTDIPRTKSGKIVELAVRKIVHGEKLDNLEALANPEALQEYANIKELKT